MKKQIIVLVTGGKNDDVDTVRVVLFDSYSEAVAFCNQTTDKNKDEKYWTFADIIEENKTYEPIRYEH